MYIIPHVFVIVAIAYLYFALKTYFLNDGNSLNNKCFLFIILIFLCTFERVLYLYSHNQPWYGIYTFILIIDAIFIHEVFEDIRSSRSKIIKLIVYFQPVVFCLLVFGMKILSFFEYYDNIISIDKETSLNILYDIFNVLFLVVTGLEIIGVYQWSKKLTAYREKGQFFLITITFFMTYIPLILFSIIIKFDISKLSLYFPLFYIVWTFGIWYSAVRLGPEKITLSLAFEEILSEVKDMVIVLDLDGKMLRVNKKAEEVLEVSNDQLVNKLIMPLVLEENILYKEFRDIKKFRMLFYSNSFEIHFKAENLNKLVPVHATISILKDGNDDLLGILLVAQDLRETKALEHEIVERQIIENELRESNERLKEIDKLKTDFLSTISHELRTPLTSILGFSKIITKKLNSIIPDVFINKDKKFKKNFNQILENISIITSEGDRLTWLINDVLDIAKMEAGKVDWRSQQVNMGDLLERAIVAINALFEQKHLIVQKEIQSDLPRIVGDADRLIQVCINLISNAIKFTTKGKIICRVVQEGDNIITSIIDEGVGIPQEDCEKIFEKFKQAKNNSNSITGTGLGLSICKQIIEHHKGKIWVESEINIGSTFSFSLSTKQVNDTRKTKLDIDELVKVIKKCDVKVEKARDKSKKYIVFIEEPENNRNILKNKLIDEGYNLHSYNDGNLSVLDSIKKDIPDLIIFDTNSKASNSIDFVTLLKNDTLVRHIPVIIISNTDKFKQKGQNLGVDRYFLKPISTEDLKNEIEVVLFQENLDKKILVADGDEFTLKALADILTLKGFSSIEICSGQECISKALEVLPDIIIIDAVSYEKYNVGNTLHAIEGFERVSFFLLYWEDT